MKKIIIGLLSVFLISPLFASGYSDSDPTTAAASSSGVGPVDNSWPPKDIHNPNNGTDPTIQP